MGFVLLGLVTLNQIGVTGAVLQMFSHGIIAGLLFAIVGRIVYDRTHTRELAELETMHLSRRLPFAAWAFVIAGVASIGMPRLLRLRRRVAGAPSAAWKVNPGGLRCCQASASSSAWLYLARATKSLLQRCVAHRHTCWSKSKGIRWPPSLGLKFQA